MANEDQQQIEQRIAQIDEALASGVVSVTTDGTTTSIDLDAMRMERRELRQRLDNMRKPVSMRVNLSHG